MKDRLIRVVVLNDHSTFTDLAGCEVWTVTEEDYINVAGAGGKADDLTPLEVYPVTEDRS